MAIKQFLIKTVGIDGTIFFTLMGRCLQMFTSVFTVFFIASFLSQDEQGYYYTFGSIVALQIFFELGLSQVITQFVAHEVSHLSLNESLMYEGEEYHRSRLAYLLHFCLKWYSIIALIIAIVLTVAGFVFFGKYETVASYSINWKEPWALLVLGTSLNFLVSPIISILDGLGKVKEVAKIRLVQQIVYPIIVWGGLACGAHLFVCGADAILRVIVLLLIIFNSKLRTILVNIFHENSTIKVSYIHEIFPFQWRIAISWISGYFIMQIFNPVLFACEGTIVAGQMGLTLQALNGMQALSLAWINTKIPKMSTLIAQKRYDELDKLFNTTFKQILFVGGLLILIVVGGIYFFQHWGDQLFNTTIGNRFLPIFPCLLLAFSFLLMIPVNSWATYLRCHKIEPLMVNSIVMGVLCGISTLLFGYIYGITAILISFAILRVVSLIWARSVYINKKKIWHQ